MVPLCEISPFWGREPEERPQGSITPFHAAGRKKAELCGPEVCVQSEV